MCIRDSSGGYLNPISGSEIMPKTTPISGSENMPKTTSPRHAPAWLSLSLSHPSLGRPLTPSVLTYRSLPAREQAEVASETRLALAMAARRHGSANVLLTARSPAADRPSAVPSEAALLPERRTERTDGGASGDEGEEAEGGGARYGADGELGDDEGGGARHGAHVRFESDETKPSMTNPSMTNPSMTKPSMTKPSMAPRPSQAPAPPTTPGRPYSAGLLRAPNTALSSGRPTSAASTPNTTLGRPGSATSTRASLTGVVFGAGTEPPSFASKQRLATPFLASDPHERRRRRQMSAPGETELRELVTNPSKLGGRARFLRLQQIFEGIDEDSSGAISQRELRTFLDRAGLEVTDRELTSDCLLITSDCL